MVRLTQDRQFVHLVFFALTDRSSLTRTRFIEACYRYLSEHDGLTYFSIGVRATEIQRPVSDLGFNISMHMIFESKAAYEEYAQDSRHDEFITQTAGLSTGRRVFDSYVVQPDDLNPSINLTID